MISIQDQSSTYEKDAVKNECQPIWKHQLFGSNGMMNTHVQNIAIHCTQTLFQYGLSKVDF